MSNENSFTSEANISQHDFLSILHFALRGIFPRLLGASYHYVAVTIGMFHVMVISLNSFFIPIQYVTINGHAVSISNKFKNTNMFEWKLGVQRVVSNQQGHFGERNEIKLLADLLRRNNGLPEI